MSAPTRPRRSGDRPAPRRPGGKGGPRPKSAEAEARPPAERAAPDTRSAAERPHAERVEALRLLSGVLRDRRALPDLVAEAPELPPAMRARALHRASETLRRLGQADAVLARFLRRTPPPAAQDALRLATVELLHLHEAAHAVADGAVAAVRSRKGGERLTGLVNAVARRVVEEGAPLWAARDPERDGMPGWMRGRLSSAWGAAAVRGIAAAHLRTPTADLTPRDPAAAEALAERLGGDLLPTGSIRLRGRAQISALPGFEAGEWWVQDAAAALPARMLGDVAGLRVLDLCAAPGGKTMQLAAAGAVVTALDISEPRLARLRENLSRMGLTAETIAADALEWTPDAPFDAILLDAPCSATGTGRRHPDMPHLRDGDLDVGALSALQDRLLDRAWGWLAPGGRMVFATCSLLPEEGELRAAAFLARTPSARVLPADPQALGVPAEWVSAEGFLRTRPDFWPQSGGLDGFFAAGFLNES
ncbi:methyltransferase domain-containing protein [Albimonas sp. CAU 1670]|uniref:RsmB/NOP family class I SAM-dependent RNA methyltransferase n=1 Tax=Albimonas sp. CAU 1670 TaxID=3032599 RepID=UPI0023DBC5D7|nr:methyltransferase domain-containing protein [Albimonas sp. CAU 1670]MDF2231350.1 methyltransferase domain-containing protein [Albimonas sp. CAU 1670]